MEDIIYTGKRERNIIFSDYFKGFYYKIVSNGSHPCCYVKIPKNDNLYNVSYDNIDLDVHGGLTYSNLENNEFWIGWDYAHFGDLCLYSVLNYDSNNKKWTLEELKEDCKNAINQIIKIKKFKKKPEYYYAVKKNWRSD
jgi:hypothetical protein